ncbi:hypothetical protein CDD81_7344 [Ophiocordyceps australis]|uniref:chitinase n=1 Tax=Ophiocordyceps australis TaxID=1399860 RepID=A0A2C5Y0K3_9HYPO|nr:hypothetical protein CDD81_7344 [Ophiocordyceps australis]
MLSIGGGTRSTNFSVATSTINGRYKFAKTAVDLLKDWGFDGIDIDWEYVRNGVEAINLVELLRELRFQLDKYAATYARGYHFLLSMAAPASTRRYGQLCHGMRQMGHFLDFASLMAYDFAGDWSDFSGHHANLYANAANPRSTPFNADAAVSAYINGGVPAHKLVLGIPTFGRTFDKTEGIGKSYSDTGSSGRKYKIQDYKALPREGAEVLYDDVAKASYSYDSQARQLVSYDTPRIVRAKAEYIKERGLGGNMFWEASADRADSESLVKTSHGALAHLDVSQNCISYPNSSYSNIREYATSRRDGGDGGLLVPLV